MMRKFFYTIGIIAASALAFSACQKEQAINDEPQSGKLVTISFTAEKAGMETRTGIATEGDSQVSYKWTTEDVANIKLFTVDGTTLTQVANPTITKVSDDKLTISATVAANATYTFRAILAGAWDGNTPKLSANQTPNSTSKFDPTADILISDDKEVTVGENATTTGDMLLTFRRQVVINKMTLKNLTAGEKISSVAISSNKELASGSTSLTVNYSEEVIPASGEFVVYFVTTPNTGVALTVAVTTDKNTYSKSFAEGKSIDFNLGQFTKFGVAMPQNTPKYYVKVTSTAELLNGDYLIVYETDGVAFDGSLSPLDAANNVFSVEISNDAIAQSNTTDASKFTITSLAEGYSIQSASGLYIGKSAYANGLDTSESTLTNAITFDGNGNAVITAAGGCTLRFNSASGDSNYRFRYYKSGQQPVALYFLEGSGTAPSNETLTVTPASTNPETVSHEGGVMNYTVTTENIASWTATSDNEAFVVENVDGGFKVTVAANESSSPRTATITVAGGSKTATISITQDAAPAQIQTVTIAEFLSKEEGDALYQLTGTITSIANSNYGNLYIEDETGSVYVYGLKASATASSTSFNTLGLAVEDQVTIVGKRTVYNGTDEVTDCYYVSHIGAPSLTLSSESLVFASEGGSQNVTATVANFSGTVTISAESNNDQFTTSVSETTITVVASANSTNAVQTGVITVTATNGSKTKTATIDVSQNKPVTPAEDGDILWQEDFTGYGTTMPSSATGTHVYESGTVTYTLTNGGTTTKLFNETLAGGTTPELLVSKGDGSFKITGIPTGAASTITLSYKANNDNCTVTASTGVTISESSFASNLKTVKFSVTSGTESFDLEVKNAKSSNTRVDNFMLIAGEPPAPTLSSIAVSGQTTSFTVGDDFVFGGTVTATYSDGTTANVTSSATFTGYDMSTASSQTVTVSYTEGDETKTTTYNITVNPAGGSPSTSTLTFTAACGGSGTADDGAAWTITSDASESNYDATKGVHYGTSKAAVSYLTLRTSGISGTITSIVVNASGASSTSAKLNVTVNGSAFGSEQSLTASATNYTLTGSASGEIVVSLTQSSAKKALYVKSIVVTYE